GAVFAVLGLLIAFTFSGATARFDTRRQLIVEETNDIGTAYLRIDLLAADAQPMLRESFRQYLDARIEVYRKLPDIDAAKVFLEKANQLQKQIWRQAVGASRAQGASPAAPMLLLPALNAMFDITTTRTMATLTHPPRIVFVMLFGLALVASLLAGHGMTASRVRSWFHMVGFALVVAVVVYVILDIEYPRLGLIRIDAFDQTLIDLRNSMN
ncbi:MAG: bestrophin-like domain, partial [Candidatus Binatia bacterium]